jgi:hypothetical protein
LESLRRFNKAVVQPVISQISRQKLALRPLGEKTIRGFANYLVAYKQEKNAEPLNLEPSKPSALEPLYLDSQQTSDVIKENEQKRNRNKSQ